MPVALPPSQNNQKCPQVSPNVPGGPNTPENYRSKGEDGNSSKNDTYAATITHQDGVGGGEERNAVFSKHFLGRLDSCYRVQGRLL